MIPDTDSPTWRAELYARLCAMAEEQRGWMLPHWLRVDLPASAPLTSALPGPSRRLISACRNVLARKGYKLETRHYDRIEGRHAPHVALRARKIEPRRGENDAPLSAR